MTWGLAPKQGDLLRTTVGYCESRVGADSIYAVLNRECFTLFGIEMFRPRAVAIVRYRYRGTKIPSPRSSAPILGSPAPAA